MEDPTVYPDVVRAHSGARRGPSDLLRGCCTRMMLFPNCTFPLRTACRLLFAAPLLFMPVAVSAQASSSSSQTGTTAAPGTAPMRSRATANAIAPVKVATYDDRFEIYGGLSFMNGQAGQNIPKRYNMGGGEVMGTYWLGSKLGVAGDYRFEAGTTSLLPTALLPNTNAAVYQNIVSGGVNYRGPKGRYAAIDFHALAGATHGQFDHSIKNDRNIAPDLSPEAFGLYSNRTSPWGAVGGSVDFNATPKIAVRVSPDLIFEHFGTELREYFSASVGVVYRFGHRR